MLIPNQSNVTYNAVVPGKAGTPGSLASNTVNTEVLSYSITKTAVSDKTIAKEGEMVHNTVTVTNNSSTKLTYTFISNYTPSGATHVEGSVKVNGVEQPTRNMYDGFFLPDLGPGETITIEYDMKIDSPMTVSPAVDRSQYKYTVNDPERGAVNYREDLEPISVTVVSEKLAVVKRVDKAFAVKGDTLTYTITMTNEGNIDIKDVYFTDSIPQGTTFVKNSVFINGNNVAAYRPDVGYSVADLAPAQSATTSFKVTVD